MQEVHHVTGTFEALPVLYDVRLMATVCGREITPPFVFAFWNHTSVLLNF